MCNLGYFVLISSTPRPGVQLRSSSPPRYFHLRCVPRAMALVLPDGQLVLGGQHLSIQSCSVTYRAGPTSCLLDSTFYGCPLSSSSIPRLKIALWSRSMLCFRHLVHFMLRWKRRTRRLMPTCLPLIICLLHIPRSIQRVRRW
jgi:hypothetical protein